MKTIKVLSLFLFVAGLLSFKTDNSCSMFLPDTTGVKWVTTIYNGKGKEKGTINGEIISINSNGNEIITKYSSEYFDKEKKSSFKSEMSSRCSGDTLYTDIMAMFQVPGEGTEGMRMFLNDNSDKSINFPVEAAPGDKLEDVFISVTYRVLSGPKDPYTGKPTAMPGDSVDLITEIKMVHRKIESEESIVTDAGTFKCLKYSYDVETQTNVSPIKTTTHEIDWIAKGVGTVKSESYWPKNNLLTSYKLTSLSQ